MAVKTSSPFIFSLLFSFFTFKYLSLCTKFRADMAVRTYSPPIFSLLFLFFTFNLPLSLASDTISANQSLSGDQTIVSANGTFELGFYQPGAVMYLFRGEFGCMLFTGDFRWEPTSTRAQIGRSMLLNAIGNDKVDILYLDNTYCNPSYSFPSREVAAKQVVDVIASHPKHDVIIGIDSLGKEDLLIHI